MSPVMLFFLAWFFMAIIMVLFYLVQRRTRNATVVDAIWAFGVGGAACLYGALATGDPSRRTVLAVMAGFWSFRLAVYLIVRAHGMTEDGRYAMLRKQWGQRAQRNFFLLYQAQAFWSVLFSIPFLIVAFNPSPLWAWHDFAAVIVWLAAIGGEAVADQQLARFRRQPEHAGKTCRDGLWKYSRHPNYFFEWIHWFTYVLLAIGSGKWWISLLGPAIMLLFLYRLTGIPYTEKHAMETRKEDYQRYQHQTSAFFPWKPKKDYT
ncbi:MAG: DUF1295 domain-containing protein [Sedimentisphaerales bacterium]|nr:DUF1295 domain-containing protein [Sedimentisphaerales bacterium]